MSERAAPRALIVVRLSRVTEATTSPVRQLAECRKLCESRGYDVVGVAEDLDVSAGKTSPFTRPKLGPWLDARHNDFDVIVFYRMDRIVRRLMDLAKLIDWAEKNRVTLVSATEAFLDLSQPFGKIIALLVANVAEMELNAITDRNASAFKHNYQSGKWRGGVPPWGYLPEKDAAGEWRLVQDPMQVEVIDEVVERVLVGEPLRAIAHNLTDRGILTPKDRFAQSRGREQAGYEWHSGPLKRGLTSPALLGRIVTREPRVDELGEILRDANGKKVFGPETIVVGDDGSPLVRAEPIVTRETFDRLAAELSGRENRTEPTVRSSGLLLRVIYCGVCGRPAYRLKGGTGRKSRYRCASAQYKDQCHNRTVTAEDAEGQVEGQLLRNLGEMERTVRTWMPGSDVATELAEVGEILSDLTDQIGTGSFRRGTPQRERLNARIVALTERQAALEAQPTETAGWRYEGTGQSFNDWWASSTPEAHNAWLRDNVRVTWRSHSAGTRTVTDALDVEMLAPDLTSGVLLGPVGALAEYKAAGAWAHSGLGALPEALAAVYMRQGMSRPGVVEE
ncbi:recombinase family protein [Rhodococcoides fascians]